jgi:hypothetical protein
MFNFFKQFAHMDLPQTLPLSTYTAIKDAKALPRINIRK